MVKLNPFASYASDPGTQQLDKDRFHLLEGAHTAMQKMRKAELYGVMRSQLAQGDSRAAIAVSANPWLVAVYTDEMDCCVVLHYEDAHVAHLGWVPGQRLLTVNTYFYTKAMDIVPGPNLIRKSARSSEPRYKNFRPAIAEALVTNPWATQMRKEQIAEAEWARCAAAAHEYLQYTGGRVRSGRPSLSLDAPSPQDPVLFTGW